MATTDELMAKAKELYASGDKEGAKRLATIAQKRRAEDASRGGDGMTTAERITAVKTGTLAAPSPERLAEIAAIDQSTADQMTIDAAPTGLSSLGKFVQGIPFVGEYNDEFTGVLGNAIGAVTGDPGLGDRAKASQRENLAAMDREYPKTSTALQVAGGVTGAIPMAAAAGPSLLASAPVSMLGKVGLGSLMGAVTGGVEGFVSGYGAGNDGNRMEAAKSRAAIGGVLGGVLGGVAPVAASGLKATIEWAKGRDTKIITRVLGVDKKTAAMLKSGLSADDPAKAVAAIDRAGPDAMLADAGPGMSKLLDTSMQSSGGAARIAGGRIEARAANAAKRIASTFDGLLGKADTGIRSAAKSIAERTAKVRSNAYEKAFARPIDYASPAGAAIDDVVSRTPQDVLQAAIKGANDAMKVEGRTNLQIMASIADDGTVKFTKPLDVFQLNELKKSLGELARGAVDQFGRPTGAGRRIKGLEVQLAKAMGEAVPEYRVALRLGGDKIAEDQALDLGRKMLSPKVTREDVLNFVNEARDMTRRSGLTTPPKTAQSGATLALPRNGDIPSNLSLVPVKQYPVSTEVIDAAAAATKRMGDNATINAMMRGLRSYIDETMANVRSVISDPNVDAREALTMVRALSSRAAKDKVTVLLGKKADMLFDAMDEATAHLELRAAVARNSATASRLATQETAKGIIGDTAVDALRDARPINAIQRIVQSITGGSEARKTEALNQLYTEVAKALTGPRGAEAKAAMAAIEKALSGQPMKTQEAEAIARLVTTTGALVGYQSGQQSLRSPQGAQ